MKPVWKHIIASFFALLVVSYCVFGLWMSHHVAVKPMCANLNVFIQDQAQRQYVSEAEIKTLIQNKSINPVGKKHHQLALQQIENLVREHPMVRTAECYATMDGDVNINLSQRVPLVKVSTGAETYYIDMDRKVMPVRPSVKTPVLHVCGEVGRRMASQEVADFAQWLMGHPYWKQRIAWVEVVNPKMIRLIQTEDRATIILGDWKGFDRKLNKLRSWYDKGESLNQSQYPVVDVRYRGQIIGIKETKIDAKEN